VLLYSGSSLQLVFEGAKLAGWTQPTHRVEHVGFGVVTGIDGKKFKTRDGSTVRLVDLLDEARDRMLNTLEVWFMQWVAGGDVVVVHAVGGWWRCCCVCRAVVGWW
jgi:hypothetical protein